MEIRDLTPGGYASACYFVTQGDTAVLIDCSASASAVLDALRESGTTLAAILLTHGHFDHMLTTDEVSRATGAPIYLCAGDRLMPADGEKNAFTTFFGMPRAYRDADFYVEDGDTLTFGDLCLRVMATPGHTRGSVTFLAEGIAFTGDTLFAGGFGRCDLYGGDFAVLRESLARMRTLPPDTVIYPGHGESARLGAALDAVSYYLG